MPCLNEAETVERCIRKAQDYLERNGIAGEVVVGDNGSTDGSAELALRCGARVVVVSERGYGAALYGATQAARGRYIIMGDADDSYDFSDLGPFLERLRAGDDLVMGNRFRGGIRPGAMPWRNRWLGNPALSALGRLFFRSPSGDFHCGLRGFSRAAFLRMDLRSTGMEYATEMVVKATLLGMRIRETPVALRPAGRSRPPHLRPWRDGWRHLRFMLLYSPRWLFLYPGVLLMLGGLGFGAWLWTGPKPFLGAGLDVHALLYAAMAVLIGFQAAAFAAFTRIFAVQEGLMPPTPKLERLLRLVRLETGLAAGGCLVLVGLAGAAAALWGWRERNFGALDPSQMLRLVIPSVLALTLGFEVLLVSFFLSALGLNLRRGRLEWRELGR
jgi:hypothetical protein